jgi:hypothetical protein
MKYILSVSNLVFFVHCFISKIIFVKSVPLCGVNIYMRKTPWLLNKRQWIIIASNIITWDFEKCLRFLPVFIHRDHQPHHSIRVDGCHRKNLSPNQISSSEFELKTIIRVCKLSSCNIFTELNKLFLGAFLISCLSSDIQKPSHFRCSNSGLRSSNVSKMSSWSQGTCTPSLVKSVWAVREKTQENNSNCTNKTDLQLRIDEIYNVR